MKKKENYDYKKIPPFKWFVLQNFPFIEADFDAITNYQLLSKIVEYLNTTINSVNELGTTVESFTDFVTNYFDNLDVQEEINNKLDEMSETGELQEIIETFINLNSPICFNTLNDMKASSQLIEGSIAKTLGYYNLNDEGGAFYKIRKITNDDVVDNMTIIALADNELIAEYIKTGEINPKQLGAYGDGIHDDIIPLQKVIELNRKLVLSRGTYLISESLLIPSNFVLRGNNNVIKPNGEFFAIRGVGNGVANPLTQVNIKDIQIDCFDGGSGIYIKDSYFLYIDNANIRRLSSNNAIGISIINGFNHSIKNSRVIGNRSYTNQIGLNIQSTGTNDGIENMTNCKYDTLLLQFLNYGVKTQFITTANVIEFNNIGFSDNDFNYYLSGFANPISINNSRMESTLDNTVGFFIDTNILCNINSFNAYNIYRVIRSESQFPICLDGSISLNGTNQTNRYRLIDYINHNVINKANITMNENTYYKDRNEDSYLNSGAFINTNDICDSNASSSTVNTSAFYNSIKEVTASEILNIYGGVKGSKISLWTKNENINIYGTGNSQTNKWSGTITMTPYKIYHLTAIGRNEWIIDG